jgi:Lrp/AsnC family transcriptional regulator, leucine-responsive regulatory protein
MAGKLPNELDRIDVEILKALEADGRITMSTLAEKVSLSQSPCWRRVQLLERAGLIEGYHARLNRKLLGLAVHGFISVEVRDPSLAMGAAFEREVVALEGAIACHNLSGSIDYLIELVATDPEEFARLVREIRSFPGVTRVHTSFTLKEIKKGSALPIR